MAGRRRRHPNESTDPTSKTTPRPHAGGANRVSGLWCARAEGMSRELPEALAVALRVTDAPDKLWLRYHVGGSYASSIHGVPRQTPGHRPGSGAIRCRGRTPDRGSIERLLRGRGRRTRRRALQGELQPDSLRVRHQGRLLRAWDEPFDHESSSATHRRLSTRHPNGACSSSRPKTCCCESSMV